MTNAEFTLIFSEHKDAVFRFLWRMTGSTTMAEDLTQDCFLTLLRAPHQYNAQTGSLRPYLLGIARNLCLRRWRTESRWESLHDDSFAEESIDPGKFELAELVAKAINSLPPLQREVLILVEYEDLSLDDVAQVVKAEISAVKARLHRARHNLRRVLAPLKNNYAATK